MEGKILEQAEQDSTVQAGAEAGAPGKGGGIVLRQVALLLRTVDHGPETVRPTTTSEMLVESILHQEKDITGSALVLGLGLDLGRILQPSNQQ